MRLIRNLLKVTRNKWHNDISFLIKENQKSGFSVDDCASGGGNHLLEILNLIREEIKINNRNIYKDINNKVTKIMSIPKIHFGVHLVNHCNLNCQSCDHFSPLADEWYAEINTYEKDIHRMSEIFDGEAAWITLMGGEPLLHPDIIEFIRITRNQFNNATISVFTNGIKLLNMNEKFWNSCREFNINLTLTKYPIKVDYEAINKKADFYKLKLKYTKDSNVVKTSFKNTLNLNGSCSPNQSFIHCFQANQCISLVEGGRLYTCNIAAHFNIFNK